MPDSHFYLFVPQPCHENWDLMTPTEQGRFCQSCRKEVRDFSQMPVADILRVLQQAPDNSVCGRIPASTLRESQLLATAAAQWPWLGRVRQLIVATGFPLLTFTPAPASAKPVAPVTQTPPARVHGRPATVQLRIYDAFDGKGLGFATVELWRADSLLLTTQAEADGTLQLALPTTAARRLRVQVPGYRTTEHELEDDRDTGPLAIPMRWGPENLPVVRKEVAVQDRQQAQFLGGIGYSIIISKPTTFQRVAQAPKLLFRWLRQRLKQE